MVHKSGPMKRESMRQRERRWSDNALDAKLLWMKLYNYEKNISVMSPEEQVRMRFHIEDVRRQLSEFEAGKSEEQVTDEIKETQLHPSRRHPG